MCSILSFQPFKFKDPIAQLRRQPGFKQVFNMPLITSFRSRLSEGLKCPDFATVFALRQSRLMFVPHVVCLSW